MSIRKAEVGEMSTRKEVEEMVMVMVMVVVVVEVEGLLEQ